MAGWTCELWLNQHSEVKVAHSNTKSHYIAAAINSDMRVLHVLLQNMYTYMLPPNKEDTTVFLLCYMYVLWYTSLARCG